jgi:hypothetical protein
MGDGVPGDHEGGRGRGLHRLTLPPLGKLNHSHGAAPRLFMQYVDANGTIGNDDVPGRTARWCVRSSSGEADYLRRPKPAASRYEFPAAQR